MPGKHAIAYLIFSACSAFLGMAGAWAGLSAGQTESSSPEIRLKAAQRLYLTFTCLSAAIAIRIVLVPVWFAMLQGMLPTIPGAICLTGVHQAGAPFSWVASVLKVALPPLYAAWVLLGLIDHNLVEQPLLPLRRYLLGPIAVIIIVEAVLDTAFLLNIDPAPVTCCLPPGAASVPLTKAAPGLPILSGGNAALLCAALALLLVMANRAPLPHSIAWLPAVPAVLLPPAALYTLLARNTPLPLPDYFIRVPDHHCLFCALQASPAAAGSLLLFLVAAAATLAQAAARVILPARVGSIRARSFTAAIGRMAILSATLGAVLILVSAR